MRVEQFADGDTGTRKPERHWLALLTLCFAVLIAQVDTSVVNLAVRPIGEHFNAGVAPLQWVVDSYNLAYAVLLLTGGLLADLYGRRLIFITGAFLFTIASLICGVAPEISVLIGGRTLTGVGAAMLLPASLALIRVIWRDEKERARALGIWAACNGLAFAIGPTLGGFRICGLGWQRPVC
jgi:MFS transporter, DHA2 family, methylenomycin A resistance protein